MKNAKIKRSVDNIRKTMAIVSCKYVPLMFRQHFANVLQKDH